jgi:hypothetical protein
MSAAGGSPAGPRAGRFLGSLKDALVAASREDTGQSPMIKLAGSSPAVPAAPAPVVALPPPSASGADASSKASNPNNTAALSAAEAAREARAAAVPMADRHVEADGPPTTRVVRASVKAAEAPQRTQLVRGKMQVKRGAFDQDPVVGWLVIVGGPGIGQFRPVFEGNNTIGRSPSNRISLDFGDDAISSDEQAYIRYDSAERSFLFVPNLAKTNIVSVNEKRPAGAVALTQMDVITMGRTQVVFVPFCGPEFDWSAISEPKD